MVVAAVHLEEGNILDLIRAIRLDDELKRIQIVCLNINPGRYANYFNDSLEVACMTLGADRFITMHNYHAEELWKLLSKMLPIYVR